MDRLRIMRVIPHELDEEKTEFVAECLRDKTGGQPEERR